MSSRSWMRSASSRPSKADFFDAKPITISFAISVFPDELYQAPRSWAERAYPGNLIHYNKLDRGGHFAAWEQPDLFSAEMRTRSGHCASRAEADGARPGRRPPQTPAVPLFRGVHGRRDVIQKTTLSAVSKRICWRRRGRSPLQTRAAEAVRGDPSIRARTRSAGSAAGPDSAGPAQSPRR
jgi:hypothetical protein